MNDKSMYLGEFNFYLTKKDQRNVVLRYIQESAPKELLEELPKFKLEDFSIKVQIKAAELIKNLFNNKCSFALRSILYYDNPKDKEISITCLILLNSIADNIINSENFDLEDELAFLILRDVLNIMESNSLI